MCRLIKDPSHELSPNMWNHKPLKWTSVLSWKATVDFEQKSCRMSTSNGNPKESWKVTSLEMMKFSRNSAQWFIWEVCDFTYLGIIHDWDHWSICPWNEVNFKGSGARLTPQNLQTCPRSVPKMALKKVSREVLNQCAVTEPSTLSIMVLLIDLAPGMPFFNVKRKMMIGMHTTWRIEGLS